MTIGYRNIQTHLRKTNSASRTNESKDENKNTATRVSLWKPNKRYYISRNNCILVRVEDYLKKKHMEFEIILLKNLVSIRQLLTETKCRYTKTLNFKINENFVKENHHLSREFVTAFTQISSNANVKLQPQF